MRQPTAGAKLDCRSVDCTVGSRAVNRREVGSSGVAACDVQERRHDLPAVLAWRRSRERAKKFCGHIFP